MTTGKRLKERSSAAIECPAGYSVLSGGVEVIRSGNKGKGLVIAESGPSTEKIGWKAAVIQTVITNNEKSLLGSGKGEEGEFKVWVTCGKP
jgi:hypothetical protein